MGQARYSVHYALAALLLTGCAPKQTAAPQSSIASAQLANAGPDRPEPIDLVLSEFAITPSHVRLRTDHAYRLHLENRGSSGHSLSAPEFFRAAAPREGPGAADATSSGGIEVAPGASKDIYLRPPRAGTFPMECSHFLHPSFGMSGDIVVE
jgi:uncharacterized cupredoxin-like copper-binding protein